MAFVLICRASGSPVPRQFQRRVLELLAQHQADVVFSSAFETAVGRQAALRMAFQFKDRHLRALGFGVTPLFKDGRFDGLPAVPFVSVDDVNRMNPETVWNALN